MFVATGYRSHDDAVTAATAACIKKYNGKGKCEINAESINGVLLIFKSSLKNAERRDHAISELNDKRAQQAMNVLCGQQGRSCSVHKVYDARTAGLAVEQL